MTLTVTDVLGKRIFTQTTGLLTAGRHSVPIPGLASQAKGVYFVQAIIGDLRRTGRLVVE